MVHKKPSSKRFSILEALRFGFYTIIEHFAFFLALIITYTAVLLASFLGIASIVCLPFYKELMYIVRILNDAGLSRTDLIKNIVKQLGMPFTIALVIGAIAMYIVFRLINLGLTKISLEFYDNGDSSLKSLFKPWRLIVKDTIASFIYTLGCCIGLFLLIVPGIYVMLTYGFYHQGIVDKKFSIPNAFRASAFLTHGIKSQLFALFLLLGFLRWLSASIFGIALLLLLPLVSLVHVYVYRKLMETSRS